MNTAPIRAARIDFDAGGTPRSAEYDDIYHPREGALAQAHHVFLAGSGLPARWRGRERFVILETGFGLGNNFLATWRAWRDDPSHCRQLHFVSLEAEPPSRESLATIVRDPLLAPLAIELERQWPLLVCSLHRLVFEAGGVQLLLAFGEVAAWLPHIGASVDAFFLDGFAPARNPAMWQPRLFKAMARLAVPGASVATWTAAGTVRAGMRAAGFDVREAAGTGGKREITLATFTPRFAPRRAARQRTKQVCQGGCSGTAGDGPVVIIGAGLAGCAAASALAEQGRSSIVLERRSAIAAEGSGNAAGLFHGVVHRVDGRHSRFYRAAALAAGAAVRRALAGHGVRGDAGGLLRLEPRARSAADLQTVIDGLGLPSDYVRALDPGAASDMAGVAIVAPAWFFPQGGWVEPHGLARSYLEHAGACVELRLGAAVAELRRAAGGWTLLDASSRPIMHAETVILANAGGALDLLGPRDWPIAQTRGQLTSIDATSFPGGAVPRMPISGAGYVVPATQGTVWFGATSQREDGDPSIRSSDHRQNVDRLNALIAALPELALGELGGRTGFRCVSGDRLPCIGAVPLHGDELAPAGSGPLRLDQPGFVPRTPGLFVSMAFGSRGIGASAIGAQILASAISGAPAPVEADLLDAVDPARFVSRAYRRGVAS